MKIFKINTMFGIIIVVVVVFAILQIWDFLITKESRFSKYKKPLRVGIIICATFFAGYAVITSVPNRAKPNIHSLHFYGYGIRNRFQFCCEFKVTNEGDKSCKFEKVEFLLDKTSFRLAKSALVVKGRTYLGFSGVKPRYICSNLPALIGAKGSQDFIFLGEGVGNMNVVDFPDTIDIRMNFGSGKRRIVVTETTPIITGVTVQNVVF